MPELNFQKLIVTNLDSKVTSNDLRDLFSLNSTDYMRNYSCVEVKASENGTQAMVVVPEACTPEILKLNGMEYFDRKITINNAEDKAESSTSTIGEDTLPQRSETTDADDEILYMLLDCRNHPDLNYPHVTEMEVCDALVIEHGYDPHPQGCKNQHETYARHLLHRVT